MGIRLERQQSAVITLCPVGSFVAAVGLKFRRRGYAGPQCKRMANAPAFFVGIQLHRAPGQVLVPGRRPVPGPTPQVH